MPSDGHPCLSALTKADPPRLGGVILLGRLEATDAGVVYAGDLNGESVAAVMLTRGAELDSYGRARFVHAVEEQVSGGAIAVLAADLDDAAVAPWVAVPADTWQAGAVTSRALLAPVTLEHLPPVVNPRGPGFRPHWAAHSAPGRWRIWPLPWPVLVQSVSRWSQLLAFAVVVAIAALALLIAVKIFETQPPVPPPPKPQPTEQPSPVPEPSPTAPLPGGPDAPFV